MITRRMAQLAVTACVVMGAVAYPTGTRGQQGGADRDRFVGAWRLVWLEELEGDGSVHRADCTGMFVFTREGRAAVQVMYRTPPPAPATGPVQYATGGYEATFGTYEVDETTHTFTYRIEGGLVRGLVGKPLTRVYELTGNQLIVKSADPSERWRVAWEHY